MRYFALGIVIGLVAAGVLLCFGTFRVDEGYGKDVVAIERADHLVTYAKTWSSRHDGKRVENLSDLAPYAEDSERDLIDPWGQPYQFKYILDEETQRERVVVWTVSPKGEVLGAPRFLAEQIAGRK